MSNGVSLSQAVGVGAVSPLRDIHFGLLDTNETSFLSRERRKICKDINRIISLLIKKPFISEDDKADKTAMVVTKVGEKLINLLGSEYYILLNQKVSEFISDDPADIPARFMRDFLKQLQDSNNPQFDIEKTYRNFIGITGFPQLSKIYINNTHLESAEYIEIIAFIQKTLDRITNIFLDGHNQMREQEISNTISELEFENSKLTKQTLTDNLTGIPNRHAMNEHMKGLVLQEARVGILALDIDKFKNINDNYGHNVGDIILIKLAEVIKNSSRKYLKLEDSDDDIVFRTGGEEFFLFFPCLSASNAREFAEFIRNSVIEANLVQFIGNADIETLVSISVGYLMLDKGGDRYADRLKEAIRQADAAMYMAKRNGRNCSIEGTPQILTDARFEKAQLLDSGNTQVGDTHKKLSIHNRAFRN